MTTPMRVLAVACLLSAGVLAGCLGAGPGPSGAAAASDVPVARQAGVEDPFNVTVRVVDTTTEPNRSLAGARVVFFTKVASAGPAARFYDDVDGCGFSLDDPPFAVLAEATTGPDGRVVGQVRPVEAIETEAEWLPVNVAVIGPAGYTTQAYAMIEPGRYAPCGISRLDAEHEDPDRSQDLRATTPVYPTRETFDLNGTLGPTVAARAVEEIDASAWAPQIAYNQTRHLSWLETVQAMLTWSNGGGDWADLYLGIGEDTERPRRTGPDRFQGPEDGGREWLALVEPELYGPVHVGPVTDQPVVTADGIDYRIQGEMTFAGIDVHVPAGPG